MATCLKVIPLYAPSIGIPNAQYLAIDSVETNLSNCAYVVESGSNSGFNALFSMTIEEAVIISSAIGLLWAVAWTFKVIARLLKESGNSAESDD